MKARGLLGVLICATALGMLPVGAAAKPGTVVLPKGLHLFVTLPATNGYTASIQTNGHRQVTLGLTQGSYSLQYKKLGRVTRRTVSADFGRFGRVSLRFRSKGLVRHSHPFSVVSDCKGRKAVVERGVFFGNVRFRGERGYSRVRARRMKGSVARTYRRVCRAPGWLTAGASKVDYEGNVLSATAGRDGVRRSFAALESKAELDGEPFALGAEIASLQQKVEGVAISKSVFTLDEGTFRRQSGQGPVEIRVVPAWPFLGTATYTGGDLPAWSGSLGIRFPGSGQVSLTGPEFDVELCRTASPTGLSRCAERVLSRRLLAGSGSRSRLARLLAP